MAQGDTPITIVGNATADPELKFGQSGKAWARLTVAVTPREKSQDGTWGDGPTAFYRVACFGSLAENAAETIDKGTRVNVDGVLKPRTFEHEGATRLSLDVTADSIGPDLRWSDAAKAAQQGAGWSKPAAPANRGVDPWAAPEAPF